MKKENKLASETSKAPNRFVQHGKAINAIFARVVSGSKGQEQEIDLIPATDHPIGDKNEGEENGCIELARSSADFSIEYDDP